MAFFPVLVSSMLQHCNFCFLFLWQLSIVSLDSWISPSGPSFRSFSAALAHARLCGLDPPPRWPDIKVYQIFLN